jgi:hypothetical protein
MQGKHLFEYAVIRVVPRVEREEFINVGVILYCASLKFLNASIYLSEDKLKAFCPETDVELLQEHLEALIRISKGEENAGPIAQLDNPSRFRWLTATRSTVVQCSKTHPGFCEDPAVKLNNLMEEQVF